MSRRIGTRDLLAISLLTVVVVGITSAIHLAHLSRIEVERADRDARVLSLEILDLARLTLERETGMAPDEALRVDPALRSLTEASLAHASSVVYVVITGEDDEILLATRSSPRRPRSLPGIDELLGLDPLRRLVLLVRQGRLYEHTLPVDRDGGPFATIRIGIDTTLIREELMTATRHALRIGAAALLLSWIVALAVAAATRRAIHRIGAQIDRLRHGELDLGEQPEWDVDFEALASRLRLLGQEIRSDRLALLAQKTTLEHLVDHLQDGVLLVNPAGQILFYNNACAAIFRGTTLEKDVGREIADVLGASHPLVRVVERARRSETSVENVRCNLPADGRFEESLISVFNVSSDGSTAGLVALIEDLGAVRTLQSLVEYSAKMANVGRATSSVVHEVRNPLNVMNLHLELLRHRLADAPEDLQRHFTALGQAVRDLDRLVQGFLQYLRPSPPAFAEVDLAAVLRRVVEQLEIDAEGHNATFELDFPAEPLVVSADERHLRQAFGHLLRNAVEAMPDGGTVRISAGRKGPNATISISDSGIGIEPANREKVFELYYTTKPDAVGIGLPIAQRLVELQGGGVSVHSEPGQGTAVTVRLPLPSPTAALARTEPAYPA